MPKDESLMQKTSALIQRHNGKILGAVLWIPASVIERHTKPGQESIEVSFEENRIIIEKEEDIGAPTPTPSIQQEPNNELLEIS